MRSGHSKDNDIQVALNGLYGLLILKLKKSPITEDTLRAFETIKELVAELSSRYMEGTEIHDIRMKLFYRKYGEPGTPLIIVHGLYGSGDNWVSIARELSARFEVYVIDQRNHGQSPHSDTHNYPALRDDLKTFMDAEGIDQAVLIGHSMGAKTIMYFAASWPGRVISLVSVDMAPRAYHELAQESRSAANHGALIDAMLELDLSRMTSREEIDRALSVKIGSERVRSFSAEECTENQGRGLLLAHQPASTSQVTCPELWTDCWTREMKG